MLHDWETGIRGNEESKIVKSCGIPESNKLVKCI